MAWAATGNFYGGMGHLLCSGCLFSRSGRWGFPSGRVHGGTAKACGAPHRFRGTRLGRFNPHRHPQNLGPLSGTSNWSGRWGLNPRHRAWEARVLPLNYARFGFISIAESPASLQPQPLPELFDSRNRLASRRSTSGMFLSRCMSFMSNSLMRFRFDRASAMGVRGL